MPIRIVHLTDLHWHANPEYQLMGVNTRQSLHSVLKDIQSDSPPPDLILITGDLAQDESAESYQQLQTLFNALKIPVYVLPGNHDNPALMQEFLNTDWISTQQQILLNSWQIVMLDSSVANSDGGKLENAQLQSLEQYLTQYPKLHALICVHHQPVPVGTQWLDTMTIENGKQFMALLQRYPQAKIVLWGHVHQDYSCQQGHLQLLASPASCRQFLPGAKDYAIDPLKGAGYRELTLIEDGTHETHVNWLSRQPDH